ncbi:MAG: hypothetical protein GPJ54_15035 [Candidatus Heimdallarchaeota archaeon]|nr:hypothetical protein [Candidatus Heimdallarchaeota archaeon]
MNYSQELQFEKLLNLYAPILFFHRKEKFRPIEVESFLQISCLVENIDNLSCKESNIESNEMSPSDHETILAIRDNDGKINHGEDHDKNRKIVLKQQEKWLKGKEEPKFTVYGRYYVSDNHLTLSYYFFYLGNDVHYRIRKGFSHDTDWEMIRIFFVRDEINEAEPQWLPSDVLFQQHAYDEDNPDPMVSWDELLKTNMVFNNHVGVLTSRGGHASFPPTEAKKIIEKHIFQMPITPRRNFEKTFNKIGTTTIFNQLPHSTGNAIIPFNAADDLNNASLEVRGHYNLINLEEFEGNQNSWVNYKGHWGLGKPVLGFGSNKGPVGPKFFIGLRRSYNYTRNPIYLEKEPEYWFNLAVEAHNNGSYEYATNQYHKMLELTLDNADYLRLQAFAYLNLSDIAQIRNQIDLSKKMGSEAVKLFDEIGDSQVSAYIKISLALKFFQMNERKEAFNLLDETIITFQTEKNKMGIAHALSVKHDLTVIYSN